jgi:hypothetical protein
MTARSAIGIPPVAARPFVCGDTALFFITFILFLPASCRRGKGYQLSWIELSQNCLNYVSKLSRANIASTTSPSAILAIICRAREGRSLLRPHGEPPSRRRTGTTGVSPVAWPALQPCSNSQCATRTHSPPPNHRIYINPVVVGGSIKQSAWSSVRLVPIGASR